MGCKSGYPKEPCPYGFEGKVTRATCGACRNFDPPAHIKAWCSLYDRDGTICSLPKSSCSSCSFKVARAPGRPVGEGLVDWKDPESVKRYMKDWRERNALLVESRRKRFLKKHPNYYKQYRETNRSRINETARERYQQDRDGENESG